MSLRSTALLDDSNEDLENLSSIESCARKRKYDRPEHIEVDQKPFTIQPNEADLFAKPRTLTPLFLIARSQLPLTCLDTTQDGCRLFSAHILLLEGNENVENVDDTVSMLIAHDISERRLYAIERVSLRRYALCRLATWVTTEFLADRVDCAVHVRERPLKRRAPLKEWNVAPWWAAAAICLRNDMLVSKDQYDTRIAAGMGMDDTRLGTPLIFGAQTEPPIGNDVARPTSVAQEISNRPLESSTMLGPLEELTKQYQDALYTSRTSLAFFAKGPLARARTACSNQMTSDPKLAELLSFLRATILTSTTMDKKYRETVLGIIKDTPTDMTSKAHKPRRKRKWKPKRDKSGLFNDEAHYIEQWWRNTDNVHLGAASEPAETVIKRLIPSLRNRETYLQIILILEIMAIEALMPAAGKEGVALEHSAGDVQTRDAYTCLQRAKKNADVAAILETLIDRLCIWSSVETNSPSKVTDRASDQRHEPADELRSFCTEVIVPFFMYRIPKQASMVSKKLGGPVAPTSTGKSRGASWRPGQPATRQAPEKKVRRPLARVSTDTLNHLSHPLPSLHRSATDSELLVPFIKKEGSIPPPPLHTLPQVEAKPRLASQSANSRRVSVLNQVPFSRREVDLSAMSQVSVAKVRKKAEIERKLRDAISTLRKPNRVLAVEEIAQNIDESFAKAIAKGRSVSTSYAKRKTAEKDNRITITATPKHVKATPARRRVHDADSHHAWAEYPSRATVSSSAVHAGSASLDCHSSIPAIPQTGHRERFTSGIAATPSRGFAKFMPAGLTRQPGTLLESPTMTRASLMAQTPSRSIKMCALTETPMPQPRRILSAPSCTLFQQPSAPRSDAKLLSDIPLGTKASDRCDDNSATGLQVSSDDRTENIYDALGWNDD